MVVHPIIKIAAFVYDFLSIHPFQDGNGRLSRLISTLLLIKNGYKWIQYVSFEHEIENRKNEYYKVLRGCQAQRPNEDVTIWIQFFLNCLSNIKSQLLMKFSQKSCVSGCLGLFDRHLSETTNYVHLSETTNYVQHSPMLDVVYSSVLCCNKHNLLSSISRIPPIFIFFNYSHGR